MRKQPGGAWFHPLQGSVQQLVDRAVTFYDDTHLCPTFVRGWRDSKNRNVSNLKDRLGVKSDNSENAPVSTFLWFRHILVKTASFMRTTFIFLLVVTWCSEIFTSLPPTMFGFYFHSPIRRPTVCWQPDHLTAFVCFSEPTRSIDWTTPAGNVPRLSFAILPRPHIQNGISFLVKQTRDLIVLRAALWTRSPITSVFLVFHFLPRRLGKSSPSFPNLIEMHESLLLLLSPQISTNSSFWIYENLWPLKRISFFVAGATSHSGCGLCILYLSSWCFSLSHCEAE